MKNSSWKSRALMALVMAASLSLVVGDSFARGGGGGGGGHSSGGFSSGSRSSSSGSFSSSRPSSSPSSPSSSGGFFRSAPAAAPAPAAPSAPSASPGFITKQAQAPAKTFDAAGARANREEASKRTFQASQAPAKAAPTPQVAARDQHVQELRSQLAREKLDNRALRQQQMYGSYYNRPAPFVHTYSDPFGNMFFWMWLLDRPKHDQDQWLYNHQREIDADRMAELKAKDAGLEKRLAALEAKGTPRDTTYTPAELKDNKDLMYGDDIVKAAAAPAAVAKPATAEASYAWVWWTLGILLFGGVVLFGIRWGK